MNETEIKACLDILSPDEREEFETKLKKRVETIKVLQSADKIINDLKSVAEWFTDHGTNTNTAVIRVAENAIKLIDAQRIELVIIDNEQFRLLNDFARNVVKRIEAAPILRESADFMDGAVWMRDALIGVIETMAGER